MGELEDFFANLPENRPEGEITETHVAIVLGALQNILIDAMGDSNQISITLTKVRPGGPVIWSSLLKGMPISVDSIIDFIAVVGRLSE